MIVLLREEILMSDVSRQQVYVDFSANQLSDGPLLLFDGLTSENKEDTRAKSRRTQGSGRDIQEEEVKNGPG